MKSKQKSLRQIQINGHPFVGSKSGFFHRWSREHQYPEMTYIRTFALIELGDGRMKLIEPEYLKFTEPYKP